MNKKILLILVLIIFLSGCSLSIKQEITENKDILTEVTLKNIENPQKDKCQKIGNYSSYEITSCKEDENSLKVNLLIIPDTGVVTIKDNLFNQEIIYNPKFILELLNDYASLEDNKYAIFNERMSEYPSIEKSNVEISSFGKISKKNKFQNSISDETRIKTNLKNILKSRQTIIFEQKKIPVIISSILGIIFSIIFFIILIKKTDFINFVQNSGNSFNLKRKSNDSFSNLSINSNPISKEEIMSKEYITKYRNSFPKESLIQGLIQNGIKPDNAKKYIEKYY